MLMRLCSPTVVDVGPGRRERTRVVNTFLANGHVSRRTPKNHSIEGANGQVFREELTGKCFGRSSRATDG